MLLISGQGICIDAILTRTRTKPAPFWHGVWKNAVKKTVFNTWNAD
jgi:hypothetical protein